MSLLYKTIHRRYFTTCYLDIVRQNRFTRKLQILKNWEWVDTKMSLDEVEDYVCRRTRTTE